MYFFGGGGGGWLEKKEGGDYEYGHNFETTSYKELLEIIPPGLLHAIQSIRTAREPGRNFEIPTLNC